jgi:hypothetical protein
MQVIVFVFVAHNKRVVVQALVRVIGVVRIIRILAKIVQKLVPIFGRQKRHVNIHHIGVIIVNGEEGEVVGFARHLAIIILYLQFAKLL